MLPVPVMQGTSVLDSNAQSVVLDPIQWLVRLSSFFADDFLDINMFQGNPNVCYARLVTKMLHTQAERVCLAVKLTV